MGDECKEMERKRKKIRKEEEEERERKERDIDREGEERMSYLRHHESKCLAAHQVRSKCHQNFSKLS